MAAIRGGASAVSQRSSRLGHGLTSLATASLRVLSTGAGNATSGGTSTAARLGWATLGVFGVGAGSLLYALENGVNAGELELHSGKLPWSHAGPAGGLDYASVRRGWEVYKNVCAACHSMRFISYRHFVNVFMTEDEAKAEAEEASIDDIDDFGKSIKRAGRLTDYLPKPYANDVAAKVANDGALPPDLSVICLARHGGADYLFHLLTGYVDAPAGIQVDEGKAYNPYFPGGIIGMPQQLWDEGIEYTDGTPATISQQAKDVSTFLTWSAEPYWDERKLYGWKILTIAVPFTVLALWWKKHVWTLYKTQKTAFRAVKGRQPPKIPV